MNTKELQMYSKSCNENIANCVRQNLPWARLPFDIKAILHNDESNYDKHILNFSLKNQIRYRGSLVSKVFRCEERYYELLIQKSIRNLCLFPYHLADMVTKGLRVTPFNYYLEILSNLLSNDKSYDTLPNFTAVDCVRVLGIGRNEYLAVISEMKTNTVRHLFYTSKPNPMKFLPCFPVHVRIEPWWSVEVGLVIESDIKKLTEVERILIDNLIDYGSHIAGKCDYNVVYNLYRRGLIYVDVPISGEDRISIPPLKNFVMNRVSGDYFENLLYKIFVSVDEHMTIAELSQMLQLDLLLVKQAVSLFCRLGFAQLKESALCQSLTETVQYHPTWSKYYDDFINVKQRPQITPLNYKKYMNSDELKSSIKLDSMDKKNNNDIFNHNSSDSGNNDADKDNGNDVDRRSIDDDIVIEQSHDKDNENSIEYLSWSDGNGSDFSFANVSTPSPQSNVNAAEQIINKNTPQLLNNNRTDSSESSISNLTNNLNNVKPVSHNINNLSSNQSGESEILSEADDLNDSISLSVVNNELDSMAVSNKSGKRVAFLFDSTLTAFLMMGNLSPDLKNHAVTMFEVGKLCEESLDTFLNELEKVSLLDADSEGDVSRYFTHAIILRSTICSLRHLLPAGLDLLRVECLERLDQKIRNRVLEKKYKMIISASPLNATLIHFPTVPFIGQYYRSSDTSHMWTKLFYNHISGYGPPSLFLCRGSVLKGLPAMFVGYGKLLVSILNSDSYILNCDNFNNINDQLKNSCVLVQAYGIRTAGEIHYEAFPFDDFQNSKKTNIWSKHKAIARLMEHLDLEHHCGYITFLRTGVDDIGCESYDPNVHIILPENKENNPIMGNSSQPVRTNRATTIENRNNSQVRKNTLLPKVSSSFSNLAVDKKESQPNADKISLLRQPDENYFGEIINENIMATKQSPATIFTAEDSSELLATELAECDSKLEMKSQSSIEIPMYADTLNNIDCSNGEQSTQSMPKNTEKWTLLDVNFGVPLFDVNCNTKICEKIAKKLSKDESLTITMNERVKMSERFHKFIMQCLAANDMELCKMMNGPPHPCYNLAFENGKICYWNGI